MWLSITWSEKGMITKYTEICLICGKPAECTHHLIFGTGLRQLADQDGLTIPLCNSCHNMGKDCIHGNHIAEALSKIIGQLQFEAEKGTREEFRARYGRSYL
jgi:hypothetical protein